MDQDLTVYQSILAELSDADIAVLSHVSGWEEEGNLKSIAHIARKTGLMFKRVKKHLAKLRKINLVTRIMLYDEDTNRALGSSQKRTYSGERVMEIHNGKSQYSV